MLLRTATILLFSGLGFAQSASFQGTFSSDEVRLELTPVNGAVYSGSIHLRGNRFPVSAMIREGRLHGAIAHDGRTYSFEATVNGSKLLLVSENRQYVLEREVRTPVTPEAHEHPNGFSIRAAAGWSARNSDEAVILTPPSAAATEEVYAATLQHGYSPAEEAAAVQQLSARFLQNGGQSGQAGLRETFPGGSSYSWTAADPNSGKQAALKIYFTPEGNRARVIVAYGLASAVSARESDLRAMLTTMRLTAPKPMPAGNTLADNTPLAQQWLRKLQGKMIRQMHAYSGMSSDKRHYLNADGTYSYRSAAMVAVDVPGMSGLSTGRNNLTGRWRLRDTGGQIVLQIQYSDGDTGQYRITQDARNWYMNGEKAFAVEPD